MAIRSVRIGDQTFTITIDVDLNFGKIELLGHPEFEKFRLFSTDDHTFRYHRLCITRFDDSEEKDAPPHWIFIHRGKKLSMAMAQDLILQCIQKRLMPVAKKLTRQPKSSEAVVSTTDISSEHFVVGEEVTALLADQWIVGKILETGDPLTIYGYVDGLAYEVNKSQVTKIGKK